MFFCNSLAFSVIQWMLAIWSLVPHLFLNPAWTSGSSSFTYCWSLAWRILSITLLACEMSSIVQQFEHSLGFPGGSDSKESAWNAGGLGSVPGSVWSPGEGNGNPLWYSHLENSMDGAGYSPWDCKELEATEQLTYLFEHSLALPLFGIGMKTDLFQSCGHCRVFQICWHIECSTFTASAFRIWNSSIGILSPPVALFVMMLPKAHLTSHPRMSGSR